MWALEMLMKAAWTLVRLWWRLMTGSACGGGVVLLLAMLAWGARGGNGEPAHVLPRGATEVDGTHHP